MIGQIWLKEIKGNLHTWKSLLWLLIASLLFSFTGYFLLTDKELSLLDLTELMWLFGKIVIAVSILAVTVEASSSLNSEFENETAEALFLTPMNLFDLAAGKILASLTHWAMIYLVAAPYIIVISANSKLAPAFLIYLLALGTLDLTGFVFIIFGISLLYRSSKNTLTTSLVFFLALTIPALFSSVLRNNSAFQVFAMINPVDNIFGSLDNVLVDFRLSLFQNLRYILPLIAFCVLSSGFLAAGMKIYKKQGGIK